MENRQQSSQGRNFDFHSLIEVRTLSALESLSGSLHSKSTKTALAEAEDAHDSSTSNYSSRSNPSSSDTLSGEADNEEEWSEADEVDEQQQLHQQVYPSLSETTTSCCDGGGIHSTTATTDWYTVGVCSSTYDSPRIGTPSLPSLPTTFTRESPNHPSAARSPQPHMTSDDSPSLDTATETEVVIVMAAVTALHNRGSRCSMQSAALLRSHLASERCLASQPASTPGTAAAVAASAAVFALANATISTNCTSDCSRASLYCANNNRESSLSASISHCTSETNSVWNNDAKCSSITRSLRNHSSNDQQRLSHSHSRPRSALPQKSNSQRHVRAQLMYDHWRQGNSPTSANNATSSSAVSSTSGTAPPSPQHGSDWRIRSAFPNPNTLMHPHSHLQPHHLQHQQQPSLPSWPEVSMAENNLSESNEALSPISLVLRNSANDATSQAADSKRVVTLLEGHTRSLELHRKSPHHHRQHPHHKRIVLGQETSSSGTSNRAPYANGSAPQTPRTVHRRASTVSVTSVNTVDANTWAGAVQSKGANASPANDPLSAPPGWIGPLGHERTSHTEGGSSSATTNHHNINPRRRYRNLRSSDSSPTGPYIRHLWQDTLQAQDTLTSSATFGSVSHYRSEQRYCQHLQPKVKQHGWISTLLRRVFGGCLGGDAANIDQPASSRSVSHFSFTPKMLQQRSQTASGSGNSMASKQRVARRQGSPLRGMGGQYTMMLRQQLDTSAVAFHGEDSSTTSNSGRMPWLQHVDPAQRFN